MVNVENNARISAADNEVDKILKEHDVLGYGHWYGYGGAYVPEGQNENFAGFAEMPILFF